MGGDRDGVGWGWFEGDVRSNVWIVREVRGEEGMRVELGVGIRVEGVVFGEGNGRV